MAWPNLEGRPKTGWQSYADRSAYYAEKLTREELIALADDKKSLGKKSSFDAMIITNLANCLKQGEFAALERERFLDRYIGKPKEVESTDDPFKLLRSDDIKLIIEISSRSLGKISQGGAKVIEHEEAGNLQALPQTETVP